MDNLFEVEDPSAEAVTDGNSSLSWQELSRRSFQFANGLREVGVAADDAWAILARNRFEWAEVMLGSSLASARYVPINWHLTIPEIAELIDASRSKVLVVDPYNEEAGRAAAAHAGIETIIVFGPSYESWLAGQPTDELPEGPLGMPMQFTGGTTGRSKGVNRPLGKATNRDMVRATSQWGDHTQMPTDGVGLLCTPAYHALGGAFVRTALVRRHRMVIADGWTPESALETIQANKVTTTCMVPTQFIRMLKQREELENAYDVSSLQWVLHTAAPCPEWAKRQMIEWFGPVIFELYGASEGVGPVIATSQQWLERPGTVGCASAAVSISILDDDGNDLGPGEVGTIYAKRFDGPPSYFEDSEKTSAMVRPDGRFTVGDVGWLDEDGFLFLADRRVDLIIRGGTNIYPAEIEAALTEHPSVADAAVFGIPDPDMGQQIKAVVEPTEGTTIDPAELDRYLAERLAKFKLPQSYDVVEALPREASGKLKKHRLRDPYWD